MVPMRYKQLVVDCGEITDEASFHDVFARTLGFPKFYGRNMNAWIDCLTSIDAPADGMTTVHAPDGGALVLDLKERRNFAARCPAVYAALIECSAFVNWRRIEAGQTPVLVLSARD